MAFYREHPVTFGLLIGLVGMPILLLVAIRYPVIDNLLFRNPAWTRFVIFTAVIFPLAIAHYRPRHKSSAFWIIMTALFVVHIAFFVALFHHFRQLTGLEYSLYGPLEAVILAYLIPRGTRLLRSRNSGSRSITS
jgi:hypothetical protein